MGKSRNDRNRQGGNEGNKKNKKNKGSEQVALLSKPKKVRKHHGDPGVPNYNQSNMREARRFTPVEERVYIDSVHQVMRLPKDTREVYVDIPDELGRKAIFRCVGGGFIKNKGTDDEKQISFVEICLIDSEPGNKLHALPESATNVFITPGQVRADIFERQNHWNDHAWETKLALREYLRDALQREPYNYERLARREVLSDGIVRFNPVQIPPKEVAPTALKGALTPIKEVLPRLNCKSNATAFLREEVGNYRFPHKKPAVYFRIEAMRKTRKIVFTAIDEGAPLSETLRGNEGIGFSFDVLRGSVNLPREVRKGNDPRNVATTRLLKNLREFLKPYGLKVEESKPTPQQPAQQEEGAKREMVSMDPNGSITIDELRRDAIGRLTVEGVLLQAKTEKGMRGRKKIGVYVISVPDSHQDAEALRQIVGKKLFVPTFVAKFNRYPRENLVGKSDEVLNGMEALWRLLRRAFGLEAEESAAVNLLVKQEGSAPEGVTVH